MTTLLPTYGRYFGLALVSGSILALQVIFTRIFSIMIWHHFTYLVIGVALLGGGAAGAYLSIKQWDKATLRRRLGPWTAGFSLSILLVLLIITFIQVDPLRPTNLLATLGGLTLYFVGLFTVFFMGGLTIAAAFSVWSEAAFRLYFADLCGAGVSMLIVIGLIQTFGGPSAILVIALLALGASLLFGKDRSRRWKLGVTTLALAQFGLLVLTTIQPIQLPVPASKALHWTLALTGARQPEYTRWNPVARVDVTPPVDLAEPMIVGGISARYMPSADMGPYSLRFVTLDGTSMTGLYQFNGNGDLARFDFLRHAIIAAPYQVGIERPSLLSIGVGGGVDMILAKLYDARQITAIDLNSDVVNLLSGPYAEYTGRLAEAPGSTITTAEGRSFLTQTAEQYDIIQGIGLDNIAALSSGAYVLSESYLYTVEAFELALSRLTPQGLLSWTRDTSTPPSETLRLTGLAGEALRRQGVSDPARHIAVIGNEANTTVTLLMARSPFTEAAIQRLREWQTVNGFTRLHDPLERLASPYADYLLAADPRAFERAYVFNIFPVTDDNPFYYNYFKWTNLASNQARNGARFPVGNLILLTLLGCITLTAALFIVLPLLRYRRQGLRTPFTAPTLSYFSALGLGYIFVEIVLIQRFTLFIGYPTHAITTTIFSLLFFSALGSLVGQRLCRPAGRLPLVLALLVCLILMYIAGLPKVFETLLGWSDMGRIVVSAALIAPLAFLMGMPFPTGLFHISLRAPSLLPWVWGVNGVFSVLGSVLVVVVSMLTSFTVAMLVAALFYGVAAVIAGYLWSVPFTHPVALPSHSHHTSQVLHDM